MLKGLMGADSNKHLKLIGPVVLIVAVLFFYQNCGKLKDSGMPVSDSAVQNSTVPTPPPNKYKSIVLGDKPTSYWRLGESSGNTLTDIISGNNASLTGTFALNQPGALLNDPDTAISVGDATSITTTSQVADPLIFSEELWFKSSAGAGKMLGFGNLQSGASVNYDRQLYLSNTGQVFFGVFTTTTTAVGSTNTYLDGKFHHVVGTFTSSVGLRLYVDGGLVGSTGPIATNNATGYVRIGYDSCSGWPSSPTDCHFKGVLDEIAIYPTALSATQVLNHYNAGLDN
jgi:hypothetical protein